MTKINKDIEWWLFYKKEKELNHDQISKDSKFLKYDFNYTFIIYS